ncbi:2-amino-4-hydroxy-6-hydroxymethyldihydropteridine diphosphokinase [Elizabethkingia sp. JS20170427COW]|uniref:2-amino-4-hydroxy-6- hydroxymethyldihydropteridine diphosphokinase n=1 Tax=Elizabethkingia sp. JS20170427COW TaxID=2583851 RepID=UPI001110A044|nr:2-amino-4-hydroxy-6-hydroxymethyldihydropteridine diphosphokinase [Elizabethkingia sp. JS20170427COW]QCX53468.1 2-amino-4-hydroxy-6-hydroxymethyldihydropteridine diphosphokinase [Elizabethkingia sp. JS20170427COW]
MSQNKVILLLGSNINFPEINVRNSIRLINKDIGTIVKQSLKKNTFPVEFDSKNIFCNIALEIYTQLSPIQLLKKIKEIERDMGRVEDSSVKGFYEDRVIDIDIVSFNDINFQCSKLSVPHYKHLYERDFSKELITQLNTIDV